MNCTYISSDDNSELKCLKRRSYKLINDGQFILVHYLEEKENFKTEKKTILSIKRERPEEKKIKKMPDIFDCLFYNPIKLIDFAPETVFEYTNTKVIFIFESNYSYENLKLLENNITIKLNSVYVIFQIKKN